MGKIISILYLLFIPMMLHSQAISENEEQVFSIFTEKGIFHLGEIAYIAGNNDISESTSLSLNVVNGYRFTSNFAVGLGVGYDNYELARIFPLFLRTMYNLDRTQNTPFAFLDVGYGFAKEKENRITYDQFEGGLLIQPGLGYMFAIKKIAVNVHVGYKLQKTKSSYSYNDWWGGSPSTVQEERTRQRITAGLSIIF